MEIATMPDTITQTRLHKSQIDLSDNIRLGSSSLLNAALATAIDLQTQMKQAHWNVKGENFIQLHELFDTITEIVEEYVDTIAERITALGAVALGTARVASAQSLLPEYPLEAAAGKEHLKAVAERLAIFGKQVRASIDDATELNDADTADVFTEVSRGIDKQLWFVESHLQ
jgi:starvation-inducible DNA-binding protein